MSGILQRDRRNGILRLTLNDPETRNSLSEAMMAALAIALDEARQDDATRVIVADFDVQGRLSASSLS